MGTTVRVRFVALDLVDPWVELQRKGLWTLKHPERRGQLTISMFPVAEGVAMDLATIQALSRERHERHMTGEKAKRRAPERMRRHVEQNPFFARSLLLDEASWSTPASFAVVTSVRTERPNVIRGPFPWPGLDPTTYTRTWTVSDGGHVLEATFREYDEERFRLGVEDCDAMMRSVRFEGPS